MIYSQPAYIESFETVALDGVVINNYYNVIVKSNITVGDLELPVQYSGMIHVKADGVQVITGLTLDDDHTVIAPVIGYLWTLKRLGEHDLSENILLDRRIRTITRLCSEVDTVEKAQIIIKILKENRPSFNDFDLEMIFTWKS